MRKEQEGAAPAAPADPFPVNRTPGWDAPSKQHSQILEQLKKLLNPILTPEQYKQFGAYGQALHAAVLTILRYPPSAMSPHPLWDQAAPAVPEKADYRKIRDEYAASWAAHNTPAAPALQVIDAPRVDDDPKFKALAEVLMLNDAERSHVANFVATFIARQAQPTDRDAALSEIGEGAQILRDLIASIEQYGNYSKEATLSFLGQIKQCIDGAAEELQSGGSTTEGAAHAD